MTKLMGISIVCLALAACATGALDRDATAIATMESKSGSTVRGTVKLTETTADGLPAVKVTLDMYNVPPGTHGFHIHEKGDCTAPDASSAGGHFNPMGVAHGNPDLAPHHAGDFGNVVAAADGRIQSSFVTRSITLGEGALSALGKAVILHEKRDDFVTQPTGDAGGRIACGVIRLQTGS